VLGLRISGSDHALGAFDSFEHCAPPRRQMSFSVYAIQSDSGRIYVGQSQDVEQRLQAHNKGLVASTKADRPWTLFRAAEFDTREQARFFEWQLKRSRGKRLKWLKSK